MSVKAIFCSASGGLAGLSAMASPLDPSASDGGLADDCAVCIDDMWATDDDAHPGALSTTLVASAAGGLAERCFACAEEVWACCPTCLVRLCHHHIDTGCPHLPAPSTPRQAGGSRHKAPRGRRLRCKQPAPKMYPYRAPPGAVNSSKLSRGWPRCQHPRCSRPSVTLRAATGATRGFLHCDGHLRVCGACRRKALLSDTCSPSSTPSPTKSQSACSEAEAPPLKDDSFTAIEAEFAHTTKRPMLYALERHRLYLRVARLVRAGIAGIRL